MMSAALLYRPRGKALKMHAFVAGHEDGLWCINTRSDGEEAARARIRAMDQADAIRACPGGSVTPLMNNTFYPCSKRWLKVRSDDQACHRRLPSGCRV